MYPNPAPPSNQAYDEAAGGWIDVHAFERRAYRSTIEGVPMSEVFYFQVK